MILVLSGTADGRKIIEILSNIGYSIIASTATEYGKLLVEANNNSVEIVSKRLEKPDMEKLILKKGIKYIVDATHPYAENVSINAIAASKSTGIEYLRFERKGRLYSGVQYFSSYNSAIMHLKETKGNILLTTGSNKLHIFTSSLDISRLYARVLPTYSVLKKCEDLGLLPKQIIAIQGPFTKEFNKAMYENYRIESMVTKDSGDVGGTTEKIQGALETGVNVILIQRPNIEYTNLCNSIEEVIEIVNKRYKKQ
ncbi:precorrin-6A/cobalt-precorrin-6A reductase [Proteiniborus ethanoligenes]|uniref:Precorrin-6A/cobalt-precorrin-6A reductase n=1 Tax=Proteiniborus ethanoligenes TaxID=415015 RepID=A0A1H3QJQ9_9FIRM|nr:precorrin-6A reductase [Proteiniborus ethanoligenes]SDZ13646.1 precorrin-6A/cobalt-precorrin-6A reductase [Proteiniborus ethanoligenes]